LEFHSGVAIGAAYSAAFRPARQAYADSLMAGGSLGVPLWGLINVIAVPLLSGQMPEWSAEQMRQHFPALVGWVVYGASLGIINQAYRTAPNMSSVQSRPPKCRQFR